MSMIKVAVIGGGPGITFGYIAQNHPDTKFQALCDINAEKLSRILNNYEMTNGSKPAGYTSHKEMLKKAKPDLVIVATPEGCHFDIACDSLKAGCHTFIEKPMVLQAKQAHKIVRLARKVKRQVMVGYCTRFAPLIARAKKLLEDGVLGDLYFFQTEYISPKLVYRHVLPERRHLQSLPGNGIWHDGACHAVDRAVWFLGEISEVYACGNKMITTDETPFEDFSIGILKSPSGAIARVMASYSCRNPGIQNIAVWGTKGAYFPNGFTSEETTAFKVYGDFYPEGTLPYDSTNPEDVRSRCMMVKDPLNCMEIPIPPGTVPYSNTNKNVKSSKGTVAEFHHFIDCIKNNKSPLIDAEEGAKSTVISCALHHSIKTGMPVKIKKIQDGLITFDGAENP